MIQKLKFINIILLLITCIINKCFSYMVFSPFEVSSMQTDEFQTAGIFLGSKLAVVTAAQEGLYIFNITDYKLPQEVKHIKEEGDRCFDIKPFFWEGDSNFHLALISNGDKGICVLQIQGDQFQQISYNCYKIDTISIRSAIQISNQYIMVTGPEYLGLLEIFFDNNSIVTNIQLKKLWYEESRTMTKGFVDKAKKFYFVSDKEYTRIYDLQKITGLDDNPLVLTKMYSEDVIKVAIINNDTENLIYVLDTNGGVYISDISQLYTNPAVQENDITREKLIFYPQIGSIAISKDYNYLFIGTRSRGIEIYDIKNRYKPHLSENLHSIGYATSLDFSEDEHLMLYCNGDIMKIYEQITPNLSLDFPNLFNGIKSKLVDLEINRPEKFPWRVKISKDNNYLFIAAGRNGLLIYDITEDKLDPQLIYTVEPTSVTTPTDGGSLSSDDQYLFVGEGTKGVKIVDIRDKEDIQEIGYIDLNGDSDDIQVTQTSEYMVVGNGGPGVSVVDIKDKSNPVEILRWENTKDGGSVENVLLSGNDKLIYTSLRYYGFVVLEFDTVMMDIKEIAEYETGMCEMVLLSDDEKVAYLSDGTYGITIVNIEDLNNIYKISSVLLGGFPAKMRKMRYQDKYDYLLIAQRDQELLAGVNITDIHNPELVIKYSVENEQAFDVECLHNKEYCYIIANVGMRILPMITSVDIHTEFVERVEIQNEDEEGSSTYKLQSINASLLPVGKNINIVLIPLRAGGKIKIQDIYHYYNYKLVDIPSYMNFDRANLQLDVLVNKLGINEGKEVQPNILLVELVIYIKEEAFVNDELGIDLEKSLQIREDCIDFGYLSFAYFLNEDFNPDIQLFQGFNESFYTDEVVTFVKFILQDSKILIPLILNFAQSLFFRPNDPGNNIFQTYGENLKVQIQFVNQIDENQLSQYINSQQIGYLDEVQNNNTIDFAEFLALTYPGALVDEFYFIISGPRDVVSHILTQQVLVQSYVNKRKDITFLMTIDDSINHVQEIYSNYEECQFLKLHGGVKITDSKKTLQDQFNELYSDGNAYIDKELIFQFSENTFTSTADLPLTYEILVLLKNSKDYQELEADFWIEFQANDRKIKMFVPQDQYNDKLTIKIIASDGYSEKEDEFEIKFSKIPIELIIFYIVTIGSPILTLLGLYEFRGRIWMVFCRKRYEYGKISVKESEEFRMQFLLSLDQLKETQAILKYGFKQLKANNKSINDFFNHEKFQWDRPKVMNFVYDIIEKVPKYYKYRDRFIFVQGRNQGEGSYLYTILKCKLYYEMLKQNTASFNLYKKIIKWSIKRTQNHKSWYTFYLEVQKIKDKQPTESPIPYIKFIKKNIFEMLRCNCRFKTEHGLHDFFEILTKGQLGQRRSTGKQSKRFSQQQQFGYMMEEYDEIEKCYFYNKQFQNHLKVYQDNLKNQKINLRLILMVLLGEAYGFNQRVGKYFQTNFSRGITLLCEIKDVYVVKALIRNKQGCIQYFPSIYRWLNFEYIDYPMISNSPLPSWLNYQYHDDSIEIFGDWKDPNEGDELMIRIENQFQIVMKEFILVRIKDRNPVQKDDKEKDISVFESKSITKMQTLNRKEQQNGGKSIKEDATPVPLGYLNDFDDEDPSFSSKQFKSSMTIQNDFVNGDTERKRAQTNHSYISRNQQSLQKKPKSSQFQDYEIDIINNQDRQSLEIEKEIENEENYLETFSCNNPENNDNQSQQSQNQDQDYYDNTNKNGRSSIQGVDYNFVVHNADQQDIREIQKQNRNNLQQPNKLPQQNQYQGLSILQSANTSRHLLNNDELNQIKQDMDLDGMENYNNFNNQNQ